MDKHVPSSHQELGRLRVLHSLHGRLRYDDHLVVLCYLLYLCVFYLISRYFNTHRATVLTCPCRPNVLMQARVSRVSRTMAESVAAQTAIEALTSFLHTKLLLDLAYQFSTTSSDLARTSTQHFLVTSVTTLPTGKEKGQFLCMNLGGSNLRVGFVELLGDSGDDGAQSTEDGVFGDMKRSCDKSWPLRDHLESRAGGGSVSVNWSFYSVRCNYVRVCGGCSCQALRLTLIVRCTSANCGTSYPSDSPALTYRPKENAIRYHAGCTPQLLLTRTSLNQPQSL
jgi:hypothetical protein